MGAEGAEGAEVPAHVVDIELAPRARVTVDFLVSVGVAPVAIRGSGPGVLAVVDGDEVLVDALRSARGASYVLVDSAAGELVRLDVAFSLVPWAFLEGAALVATLVENAEPALSTEGWSVDGDVMYGTRSAEGTSTGFRFEPGAQSGWAPSTHFHTVQDGFRRTLAFSSKYREAGAGASWSGLRPEPSKPRPMALAIVEESPQGPTHHSAPD